MDAPREIIETDLWSMHLRLLQDIDAILKDKELLQADAYLVHHYHEALHGLTRILLHVLELSRKDPIAYNLWLGLQVRPLEPMEPYEAGQRVVKVNSMPDDGVKDGATGTVRRHLTGPDPGPPWGYMVVWDSMPGVETYIAGVRLKEANA